MPWLLNCASAERLGVRGRSTWRAQCRRHCISALLLFPFRPSSSEIFDLEGLQIFELMQT